MNHPSSIIQWWGTHRKEYQYDGFIDDRRFAGRIRLGMGTGAMVPESTRFPGITNGRRYHDFVGSNCFAAGRLSGICAGASRTFLKHSVAYGGIQHVTTGFDACALPDSSHSHR